MNTLTKGFAKRALSILLVAIMVFSLGIVGLTSASAAEVEMAETGAGNITIYFTDAYTWTEIYIYYSGSSQSSVNWRGSAMTYLETNIYSQKVYYAVIPNDAELIVFSGKDTSGNLKQTVDIKENINIDGSGYYCNGWDGDKTTVQYYKYRDPAVEDTFTTKTLYFKPSSTWNVAGATYKVKTTGDSNGDKTYAMTLVSGETDIYEVKLPISDSGNTKLQFLRMSADGTSQWNYSSSSITYPTAGNDMFTLAENSWNDGDGKWSKFTPSFKFEVDATVSPATVTAGTDITIAATSNGEKQGATVTYTLKNGSTVLGSNDYGVFDVDTSTLSGSYTYTIEAACTISGVNYSDKTTVFFEVNAFKELIITPKYPVSVECGSKINITVTANTTEKVTYVLTDDNTGKVYENTDGKFSVDTTTEDKDTTKNFILTAKATVNGEVYQAKEKFSVKITAITNTTEITIYFKSSSTYGYAPIAKKIQGVYETVADKPMEKTTFIRNNDTDTADYWWYSVKTKVSDSNPNISITILSSRYAMESTYILTVVDDVTDYYFGVDNLNAGKEMVNLTDEDDDIRNFCESAVHMVYDAKYDGEETLVAVASTYVLAQNGDVNGDGKVNVRDATLLQKSLANIEELSDVGSKVADANNDGTVTIKDATAIQKQIAGL